MENSLTNSKVRLPSGWSDNSSLTISQLTNELLNEKYYNEMLDTLDQNGEMDFSACNDIEMIYFFVHQQRNLDKKKNRSEDTKKEYLRDLLLTYRSLVENADDFEISLTDLNQYILMKKLNHRNIRKYQQWIQSAPLGKGKKPYSAATLSRKMVIFRGFLSFLYQNNYIEIPLHEKMLSSNVDFRDRPNRDMGSVEVIKLVQYFREHPILSGLIIVLSLTGLRIRELCNARINDIVVDEKGEHYLKVLGKGRKEREVLLLPEAIEAIRSFRNRRRQDFVLHPADDSYIFTTATGQPYSYKYLSNYLIKKINGADLEFIKHRTSPIGPHNFRHFFAIESSERGNSIEAISKSLGHNDIKTTQIYLEKKQSRKNNAAHAWKGSEFLKGINFLD